MRVGGLMLLFGLAFPPSPCPAGGPPDPIPGLVRDLDSDHFTTRQKASQALRDRGLAVVPRLRKELATAPTLEVRRRLEQISADLTRLRWHDDLETALAEARRTGKPLLVLAALDEPGNGPGAAHGLLLARTMTDLDLVGLLQKEFVLARSAVPSPYAGEFVTFGQAPAAVKDLPEGEGAAFLQTFFSSPDGKVLHAVQGYWGSPRYLAEARFALDLAAKVQGLEADRRKEATLAALRERKQRVGEEKVRLERQHPQEFARKGDEPPPPVRDHAALTRLEATLAESGNMTGQAVGPVLTRVAETFQSLMVR